MIDSQQTCSKIITATRMSKRCEDKTRRGKKMITRPRRRGILAGIMAVFLILVLGTLSGCPRYSAFDYGFIETDDAPPTLRVDCSVSILLNIVRRIGKSYKLERTNVFPKSSAIPIAQNWA